ncbi:MAG: response regulator, partial [Candidatus Poribacteria bacterium]|nr:response regulator [Candidatus Poribacteria bacterium]
MAQTILAVDDDLDILDVLEMSLDSDGFNVITASDGLDAIEKAKSHVPDLILLDLMMPKMDGFEVIDNLRTDSQTRAIPVIMLTARSQVHEKLQGLDAGADDYVTKPFDLKELTARIKAVLGRTEPAKYINPLIGAMGDWFSETGVEQLAAHLKTAATIQQRLLPQAPPRLTGFDIDGILRSSTSVSGDFYDFIPLDDGSLSLVIADVRGKGIPAALLMVMIRTALRLVCRQESSPAAVIKSINDLLVIDTEPDLFATMVYGILDPKSLTFTYSNAGHCHPLHLTDAKAHKKRI